MNERQQKLLKKIITDYVASAQPVSSKSIAQTKDFKLSSATIRNEMAELETDGYICHPHTSAGRIPTEKGYQFFVENFLNEIALSKKEQAALDAILSSFHRFEPRLVKDLARVMAEFSAETAFVAFSDSDFYYTGISNLFCQPEFARQDIVYNLSRVIDHLDKVVNKLFDKIENDVEIYIGSQNPFSPDCSAVITKFKAKSDNGIIGLLGPTRMDYENNVGLIKYCQELINQY